MNPMQAKQLIEEIRKLRILFEDNMDRFYVALGTH